MTTTTVRKRRTYVPTGSIGKKLQRAQELTLQIACLKEELDPLRDEILKHLITKDLAFIESGDFTAIRKERAKWEYSAKTEREMMKLRNDQKWEQQQGIATNDPTVYLQLKGK